MDVINLIGQFGRYQKLILAMCCLVKMPHPFNTMGIVFLAGTPKHWCKSPDIQQLNLTLDVTRNITIPLVEKDGQLAYSSCSRYVYAKNYTDWDADDVRDAMGMDRTNLTTEYCVYGWNYDDDVYTSTIISQWDVVCDDRWLKAISSSIYMAGFMTGMLISGTISDKFGRRPTIIAGYVGVLVFGMCASFAQSFIAFCCIRFCTAFFGLAMNTAIFVLVTEWMGVDYRAHTGMCLNYFWSLWYLSYSLIAYFIRSWTKLNAVANGISTVMLLVVFFIPESPRWLCLQGRLKEADKLIQKAAKVNRVQLRDTIQLSVEKVKHHGNIWDLCSTRRMACRSANIFFIWFTVSCVYYGLSLNTSNLGGNDYVNFAITAGLEFPAYALGQLSMHYLGRRWPLCVAMMTSGIALLCTMAVPTELNWILIALTMLGKACISMAFGSVFIFTLELYPTVIRNIGLGTASLWARIGGILAPLIAQTGEFKRNLPLITFGILSVSAGLLALSLPETRGKALPETLQDGENFGRSKLKTDDVSQRETTQSVMEPSTSQCLMELK